MHRARQRDAVEADEFAFARSRERRTLMILFRVESVRDLLEIEAEVAVAHAHSGFVISAFIRSGEDRSVTDAGSNFCDSLRALRRHLFAVDGFNFADFSDGVFERHREVARE